MLVKEKFQPEGTEAPADSSEISVAIASVWTQSLLLYYED